MYNKQRRGTARKSRARLITALLLTAAVTAVLLLAKVSETIQTIYSIPSAQAQTSLLSANTSSADSWNLVLVNPWNPIPKGFDVKLKQLNNGQAIDERCYADLQSMMDACRADGLNPLICSSYRTQDYQKKLFQDKTNYYINQGYSKKDAKREAGKSVAVPGTSEHQLGLALDIVDASNQVLDDGQEETPVQKWLIKNSWKYGFILRYPNGKSDITGIIYEPWHYRYVGQEAAKEIYDMGICLEEYLNSLSS